MKSWRPNQCFTIGIFASKLVSHFDLFHHMDRVKRVWYLSPMPAAKVQASLPICAVSPEPSLLAHTSSESRGTFRQKARSLAPLNGWACAVKICHDGMLEDTNSLDGAHIKLLVDHNFTHKLLTSLETQITSVALKFIYYNIFFKCLCF